jgi:hypothetical protein
LVLKIFAPAVGFPGGASEKDAIAAAAASTEIRAADGGKRR